MLARIYSPTKNVMQSGNTIYDKWIFEYLPQKAKLIEPFFGYTCSSDVLSQIKLSFDSLEQAVKYAELNHIDYIVEQKNLPRRQKMSYASNFAADRVVPWTH